MTRIIRRVRRSQFVQLVVTCFTLSLLMIYWEQLDKHLVSHMKSYTYRYLINRYNFVNNSLSISREEANNQPNYQYLINQKDKCRGQNVLLLLFIKTSPENQMRRDAIRQTWGNEKYIRTELNANVKIVYALGICKNLIQREVLQRSLIREDEKHHDLIQQDFLDTFHNLTLKLILQLKWANVYCPHAKFVMTADDDVFIHTPNLVKHLQDLDQKGVQNFWAGRVHRGAPPIRDRSSKYYVPYYMYQWPAYPDYTAGAAYVVSYDVAAKVYEASQTLNNSIYIDDVFMGICANKVGVVPQYHVYFSGEGKAPNHPCIYDKMMTSHGHTKDMHHLWKEATDPKVKSLTSGFWGKLYCRVVNIFLLCKPYYVDTYPCSAAFS
nr:PREDICTED: lactosylceramide 1,3-N-acetyl-beta-D-glucosaminyltransferase [Latimeria chalumnae]|eukprot:XP_014340177.1 PREDICTED: lactosylceramide 1,3-N-acetyl-beta-D-glucosaminyltransferase [Latimeria chalumnae]